MTARHVARGCALFTCVLASAPAWGQEINQANTAWLMTTSALVLFMTIPGLALFYGGLVRARNVLSVLMQCFAVTCLVSVLWILGGYGLAFGDGGGANAWIGAGGWLLGAAAAARPDAAGAGVPEAVFVMFQMTFAVITPALIIGGFAERTRFAAMLAFSALWLLVVYAPIAHWVWGGGWLGGLGVMDFAGGIVVHVTAGVAAVVAAVVIGPRRGFPRTAMPPHNMTLTVAGAAMLWVGWFGFNGGSALAADAGAALAILATHLAAAAGSLAWMGWEWVKHGKPSVLGTVTGMVAGLGTVTPASGFIGPAGGVVIGLIAGSVCYWATRGVKQGLNIDDSLDVFPVHGVGGALGTLLTAVFALPVLGGKGLAAGVSAWQQLGVQALGVVAGAAWCALATWLLLKLVDAVIGLRVSPEAETEGLDLAEHDERGYILS